MPLSPTIICDKYLCLLSLADRIGPRQRQLVAAVFEMAGEKMGRAMMLRDLLDFAPLSTDEADRAAWLHSLSTLVRALGEQLVRGGGFDSTIGGLRSIDRAYLMQVCAAHPLTPEQLEIALNTRPRGIEADVSPAFVIPSRALRRQAS